MTRDARHGDTDHNGGEGISAVPRKRGVPNGVPKSEGLPENGSAAARLEEQGQIVDRGLDGWRDAGIALGKIRDDRLYKETHSTFEGYVNTRHYISKGYANKKIAAARAAEKIAEVAPIGAKIKGMTQGLAVAPLADKDPARAARLLESLVGQDGVLPAADTIKEAVEASSRAGGHSLWQMVQEDAKRLKPEARHTPPVGAILWEPRLAPSTGVKPVLRYPGAKANLARWTVSTFPERHKVYLEPYFGSGTVFFEKPRCGLETINDLHGAVVNYFRVLQQRPEELMRLMFTTPWARDVLLLARATAPEGEDPVLAACRTAVRSHMGIGSDIRDGAQNGCRMSYSSNANPAAVWRKMFERIPRAAARLQGVQIENRPALELIRKHRDPEAMIYCDPPYMLGTRKVDDIYELEMTEEDHAEMLSALDDHPGPAAVAGYPHELYFEMLADWQAVYTKGYSQPGAQPRVEVLWLNRVAVERGPVGRVLGVEDEGEEGAA